MCPVRQMTVELIFVKQNVRFHVTRLLNLSSWYCFTPIVLLVDTGSQYSVEGSALFVNGFHFLRGRFLV